MRMSKDSRNAGIELQICANLRNLRMVIRVHSASSVVKNNFGL